MIEPPRLASIRRRATACAMKKAARTLSAKMTSKSSTLTSIRAAGRLVAGVVDQHVEGLRRRDRTAHGIEVGDVELERVGLVAARDDRLRRGLDLLARARGERHLRAGLRQRRRRGEPDAASAAGDQRAFAVETERWCRYKPD